ncbi:MAG: hypothetical protein ACYDBB_25715 [Armatimonadota bacterium]
MKMKYRSILLLLVLLLIAAVAPLMAQKGRDTTSRGHDSRLPQVLNGTVLSVDLGKQQITLAFYKHVSSPDAPGKVPDEMAQKAATLIANAKRLERDGKTDDAQRQRRIAAELLSWREIQQVITGSQRIPVTGLRIGPISQIEKGAMIRVEVVAEGTVSRDQLPQRVVLFRDAEQVGEQIPAKVIRQQADPKANRTFLMLIGQVTDIQPLKLKVNGQSVQVDTPQHLRYLYRVPITARDIQPGQRVTAIVQMRNETAIENVKRLTVLFPGTEDLIGRDGDLGN